MCRDIANGGRRCPSHTNPVLVATRNAKRREVYAKSKGLELVDKPATLATGIQTLGIHVAASEETDFIDNYYYTGQEISGIIDYTQLDENSYKEFGFTDPNEIRTTLHSILDQDELIELSEMELSNLEDEEKAALNFFTSDEFEWVNKGLYGVRETPSKIVQDSEEDIASNMEDFFIPGRRTSPKVALTTAERTPAVLKEATGYIDTALEKGTRRQRIVYRGMNRHNEAFGYKLDEYVDKNLKLGQEVVFDGYQSSSICSDVGASYANSGGLVLEVLTPEGTAVVANSHYDEEAEVVLPRGARYMVVGVHKGVEYKTGWHVKPTLTVVQLVAVTDEGKICDKENKHVTPELTDEQAYGLGYTVTD